MAQTESKLENITLDIKEDFGAKGDGVTDDTDAFYEALNHNENVSSLRIVIPDGRYKINKPLYFTRAIEFLGNGMTKSILDFSGMLQPSNPPYNGAITIVHGNNLQGGNSENPIILPPDQVGHYGLNSKLIDLSVVSSTQNELTNGIVINAPSQLIRVALDSFSGHGVYLLANSKPLEVAGNANHSILETVQSRRNLKTGIFIDGSDANVFSINNSRVSGNGEWGIFDNSFLGGYVSSCLADGNASGAYGGSGQDGYPVRPSRTTWIGNYKEEDDRPSYAVNSRNLIIGATGSGAERGRTSISAGEGSGIVSKAPLNVADGDVHAKSIGGVDGTASRLSKDRLDMRLLEGTELFKIASGGSTNFNMWYGDLSLLRFYYEDGAGNNIKKGRPYATNGISFSTRSAVTASTAPPTDGFHVSGAIVLNERPVSGGNVGWVCVGGGDPGDWKPFGKIED